MSVDLDRPCTWAFDLISTDPDRRRAALDLHRMTVSAHRAAYDRYRDAWKATGADGTREPSSVAAAGRRVNEALDRTLHGPLHRCAFQTHTRSDHDIAFGVAYLQWEARFPDEWLEAGRLLGRPWGWKRDLLDAFRRDGVPTPHRREMADLVLAALARSYRHEDWAYAALARLVADRDFEVRLVDLGRSDEPTIRLRVGLVAHLMRHPDVRVTSRTWRRWVRDVQPSVRPPVTFIGA